MAEAKLLTGQPVPEAVDVTSKPVLEGFGADQRFALALFSEKSTAVALLGDRFQTSTSTSTPARATWSIDPSGRWRATDTKDGRKLVLLTVCDCDPGGWHMPIAIARKLQARAVCGFPGLRFEVVRAGLAPEHVRDLDLPSSLSKPTEARTDRWREMMGIKQTEIDTALALKRDEFISIIEEAILLYCDETLAGRVQEAAREWNDEAEEAIADQINDEEIMELQDRYDRAREKIEAVNQRLDDIVSQIALPPPPTPPEVEMDGSKESLRDPLVDPDWGFVEGTLRLNASKGYEADCLRWKEDPMYRDQHPDLNRELVSSLRAPPRDLGTSHFFRVYRGLAPNPLVTSGGKD
jgi:hypothetical protein